MPDEYDEHGAPVARRIMTAEEIRERLDLNIADTTSRQRSWVIQQNSRDGRVRGG